MYCFSSVVGGVGIFFCGVFEFRPFFLRTTGARAMELGFCIHLEEESQKLPSIMCLDLLFMVSPTLHIFIDFCV